MCVLYNRYIVTPVVPLREGENIMPYPKLCQAAAEISRAGVKTAFAKWQVWACFRSILYDSTQPTRHERRHALGFAHANRKSQAN